MTRWLMFFIFFTLFFGMSFYVMWTSRFPFSLETANLYMLYVGGGLIATVGQLTNREGLSFNEQKRWYLDILFPLCWVLFLPLSFVALSVSLAYGWLYLVIWISQKTGMTLSLNDKPLTLEWLRNKD